MKKIFEALFWSDRLPREDDHSEPFISHYRDFPNMGLAKAWVETQCKTFPNATGAGTVREHDSSDIFRDNDIEYYFELGRVWKR